MTAIFPRPCFLDANGNPLTEGYLKTYISGTTTPKPTYPTKQDLIAGTNPNSVNMQINPSGGVDKDIWLNGSYKFVLTDASNSIIYASDNVSDPDHFRDNNGKIIIYQNSTSSVTDYLTIKSSFSGREVELSANDINFTPKGSQSITLTGDVNCDSDFNLNDLAITGPTFGLTQNILLAENTSNGSNYINLQAPDNIASNQTLMMPDGFSTNGLFTLISSVLSFTTVSAAGQIQIYQNSISNTQNATILLNNSTPTSSQGMEILSADFTPTSATSTLLIYCNTSWYTGDTIGNESAVMSLFVGNSSNASAAMAQGQLVTPATQTNEMTILHKMTSGTTSPIHLSLRIGSALGLATTAPISEYGGVNPAKIIIFELVI